MGAGKEGQTNEIRAACARAHTKEDPVTKEKKIARQPALVLIKNRAESEYLFSFLPHGKDSQFL